MPTYEYRCEGCGYQFDELQSFKDEPLTVCPKCQEPKLRRLFGTGAAILFKGSGFYETDYRSESYKAAAKADQEGGKPASTSTNTNGTPAAPKADAPAKSDSSKSDSSSTKSTS